MKTAIVLLIIFLASCNGHEIEPVIVWKSYHTFTGRNMPEGICRFGYKNMSNGSIHEFEDSCNKYEIGSIISLTYNPQNQKQ